MITTSERQERLLDQHAQLINPSQTKAMRDAGLGIIESQRAGPYVWDEAGTRYIDCRPETTVYNLGRRAPQMVETLKRALDEYDLGNSLFFSEPRVHLAKKLGDLAFAGALKAVAFGVSGGEINDFAMKLARAQTSRPRLIAMKGGYLGSTGFAASASGEERFRSPFEPLIPDIDFVDFGDEKALKRAISDQTAAVVLESVQMWNGVQIPPRGYLEHVRRLCDEHGALMIVDETETGFGRAGSMFAIETLAPGVVPDIMTLGQSLSGGVYPLTAAIYRQEYLKFWERYPFSHLSTFAGSDLACVVGLAAIEEIQDERLAHNAKVRGEQVAKGLQRFTKKYPAVLRSVRHLGLLIAVDYATAELGPQMSRDLSQFGVLASSLPNRTATMLITPSLIVSRDDVDAILDAFQRALAGNQSLATPMRAQSLRALAHQSL